MDKNTTLEGLAKVKKYHEAQMLKIEKLLDGGTVETPTPITKTQCDFGVWLYAQENHLEEIVGERFYKDIEDAHADWHLEYIKVYNIFFKENKKGFFSNLIGNNKIDPLEIDKAKMYYHELQDYSKKLLGALAISERRLNAICETKFH
ncbi:MAG: CZB domain-containing protein [Campylobacterota bacterium]|nr:CZB domain-containing protein [Campylobacterota bacterium]